jgi:hypothetical protein
MNDQLVVIEEAAPEAEEPTVLESEETAKVESQDKAPLSSEERTLLQESEKVIEAGLGQFVTVGIALSQINRSKLYREQFPTFKEYCQVRWNLGPKYAYRLIESADCVAGLKEAAEAKGYKVLPSNESQVRPLTKLEPKRRVTAWNRAVKIAEGSNVTAEVVEKVVHGMLGKTSKKPPAKSTKKSAKRPLESIAKLVSKELEKSKDLTPKLKKLLKKILELTGQV